MALPNCIDLFGENTKARAGILDFLIWSIHDPLYVKNRAGQMVFMNEAAIIATGRDPLLVMGKTDIEWHYDPAEAEAIARIDETVMSTKTASIDCVSFTMTGQRTRFYETRRTPWIDETGTCIGLIGIGRDVTLQREAELALKAEIEINHALIDELNHRVRNMLLIVSSMAKQTVKNASSADDFFNVFEDRLYGLSATHDLLVHAGWEGATLHGVIKAAVEVVCPDASRWSLSGAYITLNPTQAISLGMLFHELATNAVKHGALRQDGRIEIEIVENDHGCTISWVETETKVDLSAPKFGLRLIRQIEHQLGGTLTIDTTSGLRIVFDVPFADPYEVMKV